MYSSKVPKSSSKLPSTKSVIKVETAQAKMIQITSDDIPKQNNGFNCGVFVCMLNYIFPGLELSFCQEDMPHFRKRIALSIMNNCVS